jgi:hypothetical protein
MRAGRKSRRGLAGRLALAGLLITGPHIIAACGAFGADKAAETEAGTDAISPDATDASGEATDGAFSEGSIACDRSTACAVASGYGEVGLMAEQDTVFWSTSQSLYSVTLAGDAGDGGPSLLDSEGGYVSELAWTGSQLVTSTARGSAGALKLYSPSGTLEEVSGGFGVYFGGQIPRAGSGGLACANASLAQPVTAIGIVSTVGSLHDMANAPDGPFLDLAVDLTNAYWTTGARPPAMGLSGVMMNPLSTLAPADGGSSAKLFAASPNPQGLVVTGGFLTWTDIASPPSVRRCQVSGCGAGPSVIFQGADGVNGPTRIVSTTTDLYWIDVVQGTVATCSVNGCGGAPPRIVATGLVQPARIALSAHRVLIADWAAPGRIISAPQ